jgi:hypothetical protein
MVPIVWAIFIQELAAIDSGTERRRVTGYPLRISLLRPPATMHLLAPDRIRLPAPRCPIGANMSLGCWPPKISGLANV